VVVGAASGGKEAEPDKAAHRTWVVERKGEEQEEVHRLCSREEAREG
jgi:phage-related protein